MMSKDIIVDFKNFIASLMDNPAVDTAVKCRLSQPKVYLRER